MSRNHPLLILGFLLGLAGLGVWSAVSPASPAEQQSAASETATTTPGLIKSESNLVVLDVIATDRKGRPITDLQQNDFRILDDDREESITSFSRESDSRGAVPNQQRQMILFFDDTNMNPDIEKRTRAEAAKFVDDGASPNPLMAVVNFGGTLQVRQNFTADPSLIKSAVMEEKIAGVHGGYSMGYRRGGRGTAIMTGTEGDLDASSVLAALRDVAQSMGSAPGRKSLVLFSPGFILLPDRQPEFTATVGALNKANIAVYPVDSSGVTNSLSAADTNSTSPQTALGVRALPGPDMESQNSSSTHLPANQQILTALAKGTGGFEIFNTNDFLKELDRVRQEMNEGYSLGYAPPDQVHDGRYHKIKIMANRRGITLRYRSGYFDTKSPDLLMGTPKGKALEARLESPQPGEIPISVLTPYFYPEPGVAGVDIALVVPGSSIGFEKQKGEFHSEVQVLGIAYRGNGAVGARFSDTVKLDFDKNRMKDLTNRSFTYQNTFRIAPGMYTLKLALSSGEKFAKYESPYYIQPFDGAQLGLAGPALGEHFGPLSKLAANIDTTLMGNHHQLIFNNMELIPAVAYRFAKTSQPVVYVEVYDPAIKTGLISAVGVQFDIIDEKLHKGVFQSPPMPIANFVHPGNPLVPVAFKLPMAQLQAGDYRIEIIARGPGGKASTVRRADFSIE